MEIRKIPPQLPVFSTLPGPRLPRPGGAGSPTGPDGAATGHERAAKPGEVARMRQAAQEFEALFLQHLLKSMRQAGDQGQRLPGGASGKLYQGMMDEELARSVARSGGLGLSDLLIRDLMRRLPLEEKSSSPPAGGPIDKAVETQPSEGGAR